MHQGISKSLCGIIKTERTDKEVLSKHDEFRTLSLCHNVIYLQCSDVDHQNSVINTLEFHELLKVSTVYSR